MQELKPKQKVEGAINAFVIALKVGDAIGDDRFLADSLKTHMLFKGQSDEIWIPIHHREVAQDEFNTWSNDCAYFFAGIMAITIDTALKAEFGEHILQDPDAERKAARVIMYQIRNTVAHDPIRPRWVVSPGFMQVWEVRSVGLTLDCPSINGQPVTARHHGGWGKLWMLANWLSDQMSDQ